ncbi:hypothetical protein DPMN_025675 [Dreissena polymorpha]|uniref:Uncharacterized protein n=1 Tax=Dreissena polymorpha TaxID=45954 RepID=A0A9D4LPQ0_DREPO|nr:hypothetical protein DPMN_025675 [Dreissena polymorpha]
MISGANCPGRQSYMDSIVRVCNKHRVPIVRVPFVWISLTVPVEVPGFPAWFNVVYADDPAVYSVQLGEDYREEDVLIKA